MDVIRVNLTKNLLLHPIQFELSLGQAMCSVWKVTNDDLIINAQLTYGVVR